MHEYSEDALIEQPAIALFASLGWQTLNCYDEKLGKDGTLGRETRSEVVLVRRLRAAMERLNPGLSTEARELAVEELTRDRSALSPASANREVYRLLKDGVKVTIRGEDGEETIETVSIIDWNAPERNDFFLASQFWITGEMYTRRADLIGFVNGVPLLFVELKAAHRRLENAYNGNLRDYKVTIPQLFWYNALILLSNGGKTRLGSMTAGWEHFFEWKRITSEGERGVVSLETAIRGVCEHTRLLDIAENFTLFSDVPGGLVKILAKNHQFLGVNSAIEGVRSIRENQGKLGVFWHTQGSGKSLSMVFFSQKILRTLVGNWTFVVVTDREELDEQIYRTFATTGAVTEPEEQVHAGSVVHLKDLLRADHRYVFTLIQKFQSDAPGQRFPVLSERGDVIVITDEAHRSQYATLALNMRSALPHAAFIAFTGTPLIRDEEEKTRDVFGDYVSIYNFAQSIEDGTTVPLYYENRIPELQLVNPNLNADMERVIEAAGLDEEQEKKLEREFAREYMLITRDDRLERIAEDIVAHFLARGQQGKAMVVSIDKATAVRMYDKVRTYWQRTLDGLRARLAAADVAPDGVGARYAATRRGKGTAQEPTPLRPVAPEPLSEHEYAELVAKIRYMRETDMAVVVSQAQNEVADFAKKGLEIAPHRKRMVTEDLEDRFKDPNDPLRIVFVCAMWMTGFDVPSLSTVYLDKPMRNHTLMQTIARANRVFQDKTNGLIVDYVGVFRDLQKALAIYGSGPDGAMGEDETPVKDKAELVAELRLALDEAGGFCALHEVDTAAISRASGLARVALLDNAVDALLVNDAVRKRFLSHAIQVAQLYRAILPDTRAAEFAPEVALLAVLAKKIRSTLPEPDISDILDRIDQLLDLSIASEGYVIPEVPNARVAERNPARYDGRQVDLSTIDFEELRRRFAQGHKHTEAQKLRGEVSRTIERLVKLNKSRKDYLERLQRLIDEYNAGTMNVEVFFEQLVTLTRDLDEEEQRAAAEQLSEEELAVFDLLTRPYITLTTAEEKQVKKVARDLLTTLKGGKLVLDWRKRQATRAAVRLAIETLLDEELPHAYSRQAYKEKCDEVYEHIYDAYADASHSTYSQAG